MESIYFEKQEGSLCAQHCLNALLQSQYFTAVELAKIGKDLDEEERQRMGEAGVDSEEYRRFLQQPSQNMDDSGYFSVQVISRCLSIFGLELVPYGSTDPRALEAQNAPEEASAYICNFKDHWFTTRRLGGKWFNLNSVGKGPLYISDTFLSLFLAQLQNDGYSIFIVVGSLPACDADVMLRDLHEPLSTGTTAPPSSPCHYNAMPHEDEVAMEAAEESEFQRALQLSLEARRDQSRNAMEADDDDDYDDDLRRAIQLSLSSSTLPVPSGSGACRRDVDACEGAVGGSNYMDMDAELEAAVRLSLECADSSHCT